MGAGPVSMSALQPVSDEVDRRPLRHYVPGKWTDHAQGTSSPLPLLSLIEAQRISHTNTQGHKIGLSSTVKYMVALPKSWLSGSRAPGISPSTKYRAALQKLSPFWNIFAKARSNRTRLGISFAARAKKRTGYPARATRQ